MEVDEALTYLGKGNRWQIRSYTVFGIAFGIAFAWMNLAIIFITDSPYYRCALPDDALQENQTLPDNETLAEWIPLTEKGEHSQCMQYTNRSANTTASCQHGYWYDPASGYDQTISTQWTLVCGNAWLVELSMMLRNIGACFGALIFTNLSDSLGRRPVLLVCLYANIVILLIQCVSPNLEFYSFTCVLDGFFQTGLSTASIILALELFPTYRRSFAGVSIEFFWATGYLTLTVLAYLIRDWRYLQLTLCLLLSPTVIFYWYSPESVSWLVANGREGEAEDILRAAMEESGTEAPEVIFRDQSGINELNPTSKDGVETEGTSPSEPRVNPVVRVLTALKSSVSCAANPGDGKNESLGPKVIFTHPKLRLYGLVMFTAWFVNSLAYYVLMFSVGYGPGDRYINTGFFAILEVPAYLLAWLLTFKVGRRIPLCVFHVIAGVTLVLSVVQHYDLGVDLTILMIILNQVGKFGITVTFAIIVVFTPELFPTNIRSLGLGIATMMAKVGQILSPYARTLNREAPTVPPILLGSLSLLVGFLVLLLPETRNDALPETLRDVERLGRGRKKGQRMSTVRKSTLPDGRVVGGPWHAGKVGNRE